MKRISILGSTGSIGRSALRVIKEFPSRFRVVSLSTYSQAELLCEQAKACKPEMVCIVDKAAAVRVKGKLAKNVKLFVGEEGLLSLCGESREDETVVAISGSGALQPLLRLIKKGKQIALANKEALVMAGSLIMKNASSFGASIIPIDSEQSAIWQCLQGEDEVKLRYVHLTASGGPFREMSRKQLARIRVKDALRHPRWKMGRKITIDSATLMNKGLELIEAMHLFGLSADAIKVVIHPEAIIHSMVEFVDGVVMAQLSVTDMRIPIQYALSYPERLPSRMEKPDFYKMKCLHFFKPDFGKFPCLRLAYEAAKRGSSAPCVLNAANEVAVEEFLNHGLTFAHIPKVVEKVLASHRAASHPALKDITSADSWARQEARKLIRRIKRT
jgi:1-deoxy-D-xylulose-5-phosphate reductoisomerase